MSDVGTIALPGLLEVRLTAIRYAACTTRFYEFSAPDGAPLPAATAGSHIDLHLPNGMIRQYSLLNPGGAAYLVGIKRDAAGVGGSRYIHERLQVGDTLRVSPPRNNFPLCEDARHSVLIAGGIGITPIWAMAQRLAALPRSFDLHYASRTRAETALLDEVGRLPQARLHIDADHGGAVLDVAAIARAAAPGSHLYCCGPLPMLRAFEAATADRPPDRVHVEYFSAPSAPANDLAFTVELARSGMTLLVPAGRTILEIVRTAGIEVASSCEQGVCGACETRVIAGLPDHRDAILTQAERAENASMMICCSGAKTGHLTLDL